MNGCIAYDLLIWWNLCLKLWSAHASIQELYRELWLLSYYAYVPYFRQSDLTFSLIWWFYFLQMKPWLVSEGPRSRWMVQRAHRGIMGWRTWSTSGEFCLIGEEGGGVVGDRGGSYICFLSLMYVFMFLCQYM